MCSIHQYCTSCTLPLYTDSGGSHGRRRCPAYHCFCWPLRQSTRRQAQRARARPTSNSKTLANCNHGGPGCGMYKRRWPDSTLTPASSVRGLPACAQSCHTLGRPRESIPHCLTARPLATAARLWPGLCSPCPGMAVWPLTPLRKWLHLWPNG